MSDSEIDVEAIRQRRRHRLNVRSANLEHAVRLLNETESDLGALLVLLAERDRDAETLVGVIAEHDRELHRALEQSARLRLQVEEAAPAEAFLREILPYFDGDCSLDHHGQCQAHMLDEPPCPIPLARAWLAQREEPKGEPNP